MRFAYIDSHGNEVPIPSVDALALRIELGAIGPDTDLYDAQADHWGPAHTHEIFHTLSRDAEGDGFVAPPPPVAAVPPPAAPSDASAAEPEVPAEVEETEEEKPEVEGAGSEGDFDLGLTLAEPPPPEEEPSPVEGAAEADAALDLAPAQDFGSGLSLADAEPAVEEPVASGGADSEEGGFDFGDLGAGLQLEESPLADETEESEAEAPGGLELESPMEFAGGAGLGSDVADGAGDLQLETPMSAFEPDAPPGWMEESGDDVMDFSAAATDVEEEETVASKVHAEARKSRTPRDRPSAPKFKRQRSMTGPIVLVVLLLAIGVGAYVGWPVLSDMLAQRSAPERPPVVMPDLPAELMPQMRSLAEGALAAAVQEVDRATASPGSPTEPDQQWLAGVYLANASQFETTADFWAGIGDFVAGLRAVDEARLHDLYVAQVEAAGVAADVVPRLEERADSGFVAAEPARAATYAVVQDLVDAALALHDFLVRNEQSIAYQPASGALTADPVLEAVPSSEQLGEEMWTLVDSVTEALDQLGTLERVSRPRLVQAVTDRLSRVGIE